MVSYGLEFAPAFQNEDCTHTTKVLFPVYLENNNLHSLMYNFLIGTYYRYNDSNYLYDAYE